MFSCVDTELALQKSQARLIMIIPIVYWQDGWDLLCSILWDSQHQGENIHGIRLDAQGNRPGGPGPGVPGQLHQVREGGLEADGGGDPHPGRTVHPHHRSARGSLHSRNDRNKSDFSMKETSNNQVDGSI